LKISVELFGLAKRIIGKKIVEIELKDKNTLKNLTKELVKKYPKLLGTVIKEKTFKTIAPYMFNLDGKQAISDLGYELKEGDRLLLLFATVGG